MMGVGELSASAALEQVAGMLGTAIWEAIGSQLNLDDELQALKDTVDSIREDMVKSEKRLMKDGDVRVWMRELKAAAYDMEDMIMEFEGDILRNRDGSQSNKSTKEISIPAKLRLTMPGKLRDMKRRLEKLRRFDSMVDTSSDDQDVILMPATCSFLEEGIVGRDKDKAKLMKLLQEDCKHAIIPIYGFGGLGKTTLAQMVFDDSTTKRDFDIRVWVYVSTKFSNEKIGRSIIFQVDVQSNQYDLFFVQKRVEMVLRGKKYLVVLDDLWEENTSNLNQLKAMLKGGAPGSKIIVTTRSQQVAKRMNPALQFKLDALPYDDCLKLFKDKAFPDGFEESDEFLKVGEKIVQKCGGVPLVVKHLAYYLRNMPWYKWRETLDTELTVSIDVLPSLMISYYYMPYYLRPCFVYFAAFPKGFVIEKRDLIHRWIALGYVSTTHCAEEYLQQLLQMSFLEATSASTSISAGYSKPNNPHDSLFKMHDLVHELARSVAVEEVAIFDANHGSSGAKKDICRYMLFSNFKDGYLKCKDMPSKARAIHFNDCTGCQPSSDAFSKTKWLRVLDLSGMQTVELPKSMRNLHHLQVLNLSENTSLMKLHSFGITKLHSPTSICDFQKLHYLDIHGCSNLRALPDNIHILHDLEHLDLSGCTSLQKLPSRFGELQMLSFLNLSYSQLEMLPDTFSQLENLEYLNLSFCSKLKHLHTLSFKRMKGLLYLNMSGCTWLEALPEFYGDNDGCLNLEILDLSDCDRLIELSESCARLNKLQFLSLSGCSRIQNIIHFLGKFVKLEYLNLSGVPLPGFDVRKDSEAPTSSTGHSSGYSGEDLRLKMLNGITKTMPRLKYLSAGGWSLFSKEGISEDFLTLPDFVVSTRSGGNSSNITLLQNIFDPAHRELNIRCLEAVMSAEEAATVELDRKHWLDSLSLEWSSTEWYTPSEPTVKTMAVLERLQPHQNLKQLTIKGYNHSTFPRWIMGIHYTLPNLVKLVLSDLVWCDHLPTPANLSSIEELEIRNMPRLKGACLAPCKNLNRLSLVALERGFTLRFIQETNRNCQGIHDVELDRAEESETPEVARTQSGNPSQGNREREQMIMKGNMRGNAGVRRLSAAVGFQREAQMSEVRASSSALSATKEAVPTLCCLKIEYCQVLKLYLSINCEEYFINESQVEFITDTGSSTPILARKMHFKNCSHHTARLLHDVHIRTHELVIDGCDKEFLNYMDNKFKKVYDAFDLCDKESLNFAIQKLKITNTEEFDLEYLPSIPSLQELEIDCINEICIDSYGDSWGRLDKLKTLKRMDKLEKITLLSRENCLSTDSGEALLLAIPHIQYININEAIYLADFHLLHQNRDFGITELCLTNLQLVKKATEVDPGELARYDQLRRLSLRWSDRRPNKADTTDDSAVLQRLQPHANLSALEIRGYQGATFCAWMSNANLYVPNLVKIELVGLPICKRLPSLGQLANLEELHISNMPNIREVDSCFYGGKHPFRRLRELHIHGMKNLEVWCTNLEPSAAQISWNDDEQQLQGDETFPCLEHLIVKGCPRLTLDSGFEACIRRIIGSCSEVELSPGIFVGSSQLSRLEAETNIFGFSDGLELLRYSINLSNLSFKSNSYLITLPGIIQKCQTLRSLQILNCWNFSVLPDWLGDLTSLEELEVHAPKLQCLPHSIQGLTSLKTLTLKKCNHILRERCSFSGEDYDKIKHINKLDVQGIEISSSRNVALLEKTRSHQLIELNIKDHEYLSSSEAEKINLGKMSSTPRIIEVPMSSSLGAMGPLLWKLDSMLASESHLQRSAKEAIKLLKEDLEEINANLVELSMVEHPNYKTRYWMHEVRELSYHIEDCIDNMVLSRAATEAKVRFSGRRPQLRVHRRVKILCFPKTVKPFASLGLRRTLILSVSSSLVRHPGFLKRFSLSWRHESRHGAPLAQLHQALLLIRPPPLSARIAELRTMLREASERHERYQLQDCVSSEPRFLFSWNSRAPVSSSPGAAANLFVVVDGMRGKLTSWLIDEQTEAEHQQLKVLSIIGPAGVGKTALVKELYRQLGHQFECRAFVRLSRNPDMRRLLGEILAQVQGRKRDYEYEAASTADNLMDSIRSHLQEKRYFVVIDELWDSAAWDIMNIAFPKGNNCSRIIITAEGKDVASKCYYVNNLEMAPLGSLLDSGKIFFDRVFGSEYQCPDQLKDISCMIIRSCGGFPLAITTVASLLASQIDNIELWDYLQQCFVSRLTGVTLEETCKEVINICYDSLPQDLKTCLLYLTMYPEGSTIRKADLLNQWIAEGFVTPKEENQTVAESYFAELINRGMIQPEKIDHNDEVLSCTVHHIVFDLIAQKSREENLITAVDYSQAMPGFSMITRRLSLHFSCAQFAAKPEGLKLSQVRSLAFYGLLKCMPSITEFKFLRVLILEFWGDNYHHNTTLDLSKLGILFHLRYLKVSSHIFIVLPSQIRRLKSLETLEIDAQVSAVPTDIFHLPGLLHLSLPNGTELPDGIGRITSLQTLEYFELGSNSEDNAKSLGELMNLQNLHVTCSKALSDHHLKRNLVALSSSIGKLANLKSLRVGPFAVGMTMFIDQDDMPCAPKLLERLELSPSSFIFSRLPTWIGALQKLCVLKIAVRVLLSSDIDTLTGLPVLAVLSLYVQKPNAESVVFNSGSLPTLKYFKYRCAALRLGFQNEALPNLQRLKLCFNVHRAGSYTSSLAGIENLLKLKEITAEIGAAAGAHESDRKAAESVLKEATRKHPRFPIHMNVKSVDCIEEESTPVGFMHRIPYILGFLALAVVVVVLIMLFWY